MFRLCVVLSAVSTHVAAVGCQTYEAPTDCVFPFTYGVDGDGKPNSYTECTGTNSYIVKWCSTTSDWQGKWKKCECKDGLSSTEKQEKVKSAILGGVVATGVAATGVGLLAAAIHQSIVGKASTSPIPTQPIVVNGIVAAAAPVTIAPAPVVPVATVAPFSGRLLAAGELRGYTADEKSAIEGGSNRLGGQEFGYVFLLGCSALFLSAVVYIFRGTRKRDTNYMEVDTSS